MNKTDVAIGLGFLLVGAWTLFSDQFWLGLGFVALGALFILTAFSPRASTLLHGPVLRRK